VISDSSSESEAEDPLMPCNDTKVGGAQEVTSVENNCACMHLLCNDCEV
jgi:hypothetical protein